MKKERALTQQEIENFLVESRSKLADIKKKINRRSRRKPREADKRRRYDFTDDMIVLRRYAALGNQSAVGRELGISRQAVKKLLDRITKEQQQVASETIFLIELIYGRSQG